MKILGIDPGIANTGWAVLEERKVIATGTIRTSPKMARPARLYKIRCELALVLGFYEPSRVVMERLGRFTRNTAHTSVEAQGVIRLTCWEYSRYTHDFAPMQVKKAVTGNGRATKDEVAEVVRAITGWEGGSNHEADAVAIALTFQSSK